MMQIKKNKGKCEILPLALHLARTGHIYIYIYNLFSYVYIISCNLLIECYNIDHIYDGVHISISAVS